MHLKFGYFVLYTPIYRFTKERKRFHVQNCPCGTVGAKIGYTTTTATTTTTTTTNNNNNNNHNNNNNNNNNNNKDFN